MLLHFSLFVFLAPFKEPFDLKWTIYDVLITIYNNFFVFVFFVWVFFAVKLAVNLGVNLLLIPLLWYSFLYNADTLFFTQLSVLFC